MNPCYSRLELSIVVIFFILGGIVIGIGIEKIRNLKGSGKE